MAVRRHIYAPWYKRLESTFAQGLDARFMMIQAGEQVLDPAAFVGTLRMLSSLRAKYTAALVEIVEAVDRRARGTAHRNEEERR